MAGCWSVSLMSVAKAYLVSYRPLSYNAYGRAAVYKYDLPPFIDGSCRREPDFESPFPSITCTLQLVGDVEPAVMDLDSKTLTDCAVGVPVPMIRYAVVLAIV